jgi:hypothetical protein
MSLTGALLAVFIQQWAQSYLEATHGRHSPHDRARIRVFHAEGLEDLDLNRVTRAVPILIHISLFLFFSGLPIFLFNVNRTVFNVVITWLALCVTGYACITLMPIFRKNSPYYSPLSSSIWWCVTNTLFIIYQLLKNFISRDSSVFRWYDKHYAMPHLPWPSLRAMQKAAGRFALQLSSDIDYRALSWMFKTLNDDDEFEQFFDALPSLHGSKALKDADSKFIVPNEESLSHALIGMMDRTLLSELISEEVKQRRIIICTKAVGATSLLGPGWTLRRVLCGEWHGFSRSIHFGLCVQDWKNISHPLLAFYMQCAVAVTLTTVQKRDDHWFQLASGQLNQSKTLLRNYFADDDSILLDDAIFIIRRTMETFSGSKDHRSDIREASSKTLELICSFNIKKTLETLRHQFCSLWNELVDKAKTNSDPDFRSLCIMMLKSTRRLYITQHENTSSAPREFSTTTDDFDRVLGYAWSYPMCRNHIHHPSRLVLESKLDGLPRNVPHVTASFVDVTTSFQVMPPRLTTPPTRVIPLDQTPPFTVRNLPHPFIPSPNFPVAPPAGPSNSGVSGPYNPYPYPYLHSSGISQMELRDEYVPADIVPPSRPESPFGFSRTPSFSQMAPRSEDVPTAMGEVYSRQSTHSHFAPSESSSTSSSELPMIDIVPPSPTESLSDFTRTDGHYLSAEDAHHVRFALGPSESPTSSSESLEIAIVAPSKSPESSPPVSPLDISRMVFGAEDTPAVMGEVIHNRAPMSGSHHQNILLRLPPSRWRLL